jgi:hypothetical protein
MKKSNSFDSNPLQKPYNADFDTENAYRKPPVTSLFLRIFPAANERSALENIDQSQIREF